MGRLYVGTTIPKNIYIGSTAAVKAYIGSTQVWPEPPPPNQARSFTAPGDNLFTISGLGAGEYTPVKLWVHLLGGGGSGGVGGGVMNGGGGGAGKWASIEMLKGVHFDAGDVINFHVGAGGTPHKSNHSAVNNPAPVAANDGQPTYVVYKGIKFTAEGGKCNAGFGTTHNGYSPGTYTSPWGVNQTGGVTPAHATAQAVPESGGFPGAGGSGSATGGLVNGNDGGAGANGKIWVSIRYT